MPELYLYVADAAAISSLVANGRRRILIQFLMVLPLFLIFFHP